MPRRAQGAFEFRTWGGKRPGAGRKRIAPRKLVPHRRRRELDGRTPVHLTLRVCPAIRSLRRRDQYTHVRRALARTAHKPDFRIIHFSIQGNHIHLIAEPAAKAALRRGITGFITSSARRLNAHVGRRGKVYADRYDCQYLDTPAQVRAAIGYTLNNFRKHGEDRWDPRAVTDAYSSADFFDGFRDHVARPPPWVERLDTPPVAAPRFWLTTVGWRRHGLIDPRAVPGPRRA